jgi:hypothetical protein
MTETFILGKNVKEKDDWISKMKNVKYFYPIFEFKENDSVENLIKYRGKHIHTIVFFIDRSDIESVHYAHQNVDKISKNIRVIIYTNDINNPTFLTSKLMDELSENKIILFWDSNYKKLLSCINA